jgi:hypothetical protein
MLLITSAWPEEFTARASTAKSLSANLGLDHDLAILAGLTRNFQRDQMSEAAVKRIVAASETRQRALRAVAAQDLDRLFAERPRDFEARMRRYLGAGMLANAKPS